MATVTITYFDGTTHTVKCSDNGEALTAHLERQRQAELAAGEEPLHLCWTVQPKRRATRKAK